MKISSLNHAINAISPASFEGMRIHQALGTGPCRRYFINAYFGKLLTFRASFDIIIIFSGIWRMNTMIFYASAKAMQRYHLKTPDKLSPANVTLGKSIFARDRGDGRREWGVDFFLCMGRDCLTVTNCASRFTLFLFGTTQENLYNLGDILAQYLLELYAGDIEMRRCLRLMFKDDSIAVFSPIRNRSVTAMLNYAIVDYANRGELFRDYVDYKSVVHTRQINYDFNFNHALKRLVDGEEIEFFPGQRLRQIVTERYGGK